MLYIIKWEYSDFIYLFFGLGIVFCCTYFIKTKQRIKYCNKHTDMNNKNAFLQLLIIFLFVILSFISVFGLGQKIYGIISYNCENYEIVEGSISNFINIYAHNSNQVRGISFDIDEISFELDRGILNAGYSFEKGIISDSGDKMRIYYMPPRSGDKVNLILRIDSLQEK